jgi:hypothetical protein
MMYVFGSFTGLALAFTIHAIAVVLFLAGIILLLGYAIKYLPAADLKKWGWILALVGVILSLLTVFLIPSMHMGAAGSGNMMYNNSGIPNMMNLTQ